ncbi:MAG: hypothetical protein EOM19_02130 [Candidatus Moranbacteria bacterium]|nr:hypothetical protein [Candidatus Moranbacteria bacterium]
MIFSVYHHVFRICNFFSFGIEDFLYFFFYFFSVYLFSCFFFLIFYYSFFYFSYAESHGFLLYLN